MSKKKLTPLHISLRKNELFLRRQNRNVSSMEEAHKILKEVDPDFTETIKASRQLFLNSLEK